MDPADAKRFLISRVIAEADREHVPLLDVEKRMLAFSESDPSFTEDVVSINDEFERSCNSDVYESKVTLLLKNARDQDIANLPQGDQDWSEALQALRKEDHYILVMAASAFPGEAGGVPGGRMFSSLVYGAIGIGLVLLVVWKALR
jgi:hypothetical protein